ncbi:hypothetical protein CN425_14180 [Bacillus cereus]|uniref:Uncharacterized protein n=1 Tax=Bacillus cereus TaxID=1396 RepID=A0A2A8PVU9_BACCE|nr:hypothetical protein [Bacillus cereus]EJS70178.1 hypothetical protein ICU_01834 [Bacillus cereus BAG2X1-1]EJS77079.1 hypothetical protein ICY_01705 [Bacillus cereus BAG2X1-3]PEA07206.1 hypothetical protein CON38_23335 [Bacillus cereus]PEW01225.1 hypothetical protein CN425_14180 [Bacillus cereus]PFI16706.1 hypothetical protein COI75_21405 [Bacillus cereus]
MIIDYSPHSLTEIRMIPIEKINPLYNPHITKSYSKKMPSTIEYLDTFDLLLPVEKHPQKDEYILVGKYDCYNFITNTPHIRQVPCIIEDFTEKSSQYLKILRRLHTRGDSHKTNRQFILNKLEENHFPLLQILKQTGFTKHDLRDYNYKITVPKNYINSHTTEKTLNWISDLKLKSTIKQFLYTCAGLPIGNHMRLTEEKKKFLQHFFAHANEFEQLTNRQQIKILTNALNFKAIMTAQLQQQINYYLIK